MQVDNTLYTIIRGRKGQFCITLLEGWGRGVEVTLTTRCKPGENPPLLISLVRRKEGKFRYIDNAIYFAFYN